MTAALLGIAAVWLALINLIAVLVFRHDKRAAVARRRRVPERVLLTFAALGASPGLVVASSAIRHKTRKQPFRGLLFAILAAQIIALALLGANGVGLI